MFFKNRKSLIVRSGLILVLIFGAFGVLPVGASAGAPIFAPYVTFPVGGGYATGIGDFNSDGLQDVAMTTSSQLMVFLQNADGSLASPVAYDAGAKSETLAVGDLNNDNRTDIVIANNNDDTISVFLQQLDGSFASHVTYPTSSDPDALAIGDINGDGLADVAVSHWTSPYIGIFTQSPAGRLNPMVTYASPVAGWDDLAIADVNHDGRSDVIKMNGQGQNPNLSVYMQTPDGTLAPALPYSVSDCESFCLSHGLGTGDVTGDGLTDIVVSYGGNRSTARVAVFAQAPDGSLQTSAAYEAYDLPYPVEVSDVNNDGLTDVVVAHLGWSAVSVFPQQNNGTLDVYSRYTVPYGNYRSQALSVGDLNQDGLSDIALADDNDGLVVLYQIPAPDTATPTSTATETLTPTVTFTPTQTGTPTRTPIVFMVTTTADSGTGSLRQVITSAPSGATIRFDPSLAGQTITLVSPVIINDKRLILDGSGLSPQVTISGGGTVGFNFNGPSTTMDIYDLTISSLTVPLMFRVDTTIKNSTLKNFAGDVLRALAPASLTIIDSTLEGSQGAAIVAFGSATTITNSILRNNTGRVIQTSGSGPLIITNSTISGSQGDAIIASGPTTITNSSVIGNRGLAIITSGMPLSLINTTIYQNLSGAMILNGSETTIVNSTIAQNPGRTADILVNGVSDLAIFNSTIVADTYRVLFLNGGTTLNVNNSILFCTHPDECFFSNGANIINNINSIVGENGTLAEYGLNEPADNGGPTFTMALSPGSPLIDTGDDTICANSYVNNLDQRGVTRPAGVHCDVGAYEYDGVIEPPTSTSTPTDTPTNTPTFTPTYTPTNTPTSTPTNTPTATPPYSYQPLYFSLAANQTLGSIASADEDILRFDGTNLSLLFDGSDVGVENPDLFAFSLLDEDTLLMAFSSTVTVNGITAAPQDVLRFDADSLGSTTAGTFSLYFDGSDVGLTTSAESLDALSLLPDGRLLLSTTGNPSVPGLTTGQDEDVLAFIPTSLGTVTSGTWSLYFDGSDVGLAETSDEDIDALDVVGENIYLSTLGNFSVTGLAGADEDVFVCAASSLGDVTTCNYSPALYFDGSTWGLTSNDIDAFHFLALKPVPTDTPTAIATNTPTDTPTDTHTPTFTPTFISTPVVGCNSIRDTVQATTKPIKFSLTNMYLDIPNTNSYPVTISSIYVAWNYNQGHMGSNSNLKLMSVKLGSSTIWQSSAGVHQPNYTISSFSSPAILSAAGTSRLTFTFDQTYDRASGEGIQIQFSTPGCEAYPIVLP